MTRKQEKFAIWICNLLAPLLLNELDALEEEQFLKALSKKEVTLPSGKSRTIRMRTWRKWLNKYRQKGFQGMIRKPRSDLGLPRKQREALIAMAIEIKKDLPSRSGIIINQFLYDRFHDIIPCSTLYRHLKKAGATRLKLGLDKQPARKQWTCEHTHDMWLCDFANGPYVIENGQIVPTYLIAFIDKYSRFVVASCYALKQDFIVFSSTMVDGIEIHGAPLWFLADNGEVFRSMMLQNACIRISIGMLYRPVGEPESGGGIERFIQTVQSQYEEEVRARDMPLDLATLNKAYQAWLNTVYHETVNRETGQTPSARYRQGLLPLRQVDLEVLKECFLKRVTRTVNKTFSDVSINGLLYKVDLKLRGDKVEVRYDPSKPYDAVALYTEHGEYLGQGIFHQRQETTYPQPAPSASKGPKIDALDLFITNREKQIKAEQQSFNQKATGQPRDWSFSSMAAAWASLTGRSGGISAFNESELALLQQIHESHPHLTLVLLKKAVANASSLSFMAIINEIQKIEENM